MPSPQPVVPDFFSEFLDSLGADAAMMIRAYFDESGTHAGSPLTCVAGYLFQDRDARLLDKAWKKVLDEAGLKRFHMRDCAHGSGEFRKIPKSERIAIEKKLIAAIKKRATIGIVVSVCESDFLAINEPNGSPYVLCLLWCLAGVSSWVHKHQYEGKISYFFEAGHDRQGLAHRAMLSLNDNPNLKKGCCYHSHVFIGKDDARPIQAADLLAWQWQAEWKNRFGEKKRPRRADLVSLLKAPHIASHLDASNLKALAASYYRSKNQSERLRYFGTGKIPSRHDDDAN